MAENNIERDLHIAISSIESVIKKLNDLHKQTTEETVFEKQVLDSGKNTANVTKCLLDAVCAVMKEQGANTKDKGVVAQAKLMAIDVHNMYKAIDELVKGTPEAANKLVSVTEGIAKHCKDLLHLRTSATQTENKQIQKAGAQVLKATDTLVKVISVGYHVNSFDKNENDKAMSGAVKNMMQEMEKQEEILRKRREIEALERELVKIRAS